MLSKEPAESGLRYDSRWLLKMVVTMFADPNRMQAAHDPQQEVLKPLETECSDSADLCLPRTSDSAPNQFPVMLHMVKF